MILSVSDCERTKVQKGARVLDMKIAEIGKSRGLQVVGLETIPAQLEALAAVPEQQQIDMLRASLKFADRTNDLMETLVQLYLNRKITAAMPVPDRPGQAGRRQRPGVRRLPGEAAVERNVKMRDVAEPLLDKGGVFIAVGALHLPGDKGLVALLREAATPSPPSSRLSSSRFPGLPCEFVHAAFHPPLPSGRGRTAVMAEPACMDANELPGEAVRPHRSGTRPVANIPHPSVALRGSADALPVGEL